MTVRRRAPARSRASLSRVNTTAASALSDAPLASTRIGEGSRRVAFLHGLMGRGRNFTGPAKELGDDFTVELIDLPDHGASPWTDRVDYVDMAELLAAEADPVHPARIYGELLPRLADDAVVIGDGGDFVSWAGRFVEPARPGSWLDPGPFGCLGAGLGAAIAARIARPSSPVVLLLGDGASGTSLMDVDTLVRHDLPVVMVMGNNGAWGLEKQPMQMLYGYDVAADLAPQTRYDEVVRALGGAGEMVTDPRQIGAALDRAFASGVPYLVNVVTDPQIPIRGRPPACEPKGGSTQRVSRSSTAASSASRSAGGTASSSALTSAMRSGTCSVPPPPPRPAMASRPSRVASSRPAGSICPAAATRSGSTTTGPDSLAAATDSVRAATSSSVSSPPARVLAASSRTRPSWYWSDQGERSPRATVSGAAPVPVVPVLATTVSAGAGGRVRPGSMAEIGPSRAVSTGASRICGR